MRMMVAAMAMAAGVSACSGPPVRSETQGSPAAAQERQMDQAPSEAAPEGAPVAGLPFSQGQSFATLDDYLAFLRKRSAYDVPYWQEVSPGVYRAVAGRAGPQAQTYTREELERRFGFRP